MVFFTPAIMALLAQAMVMLMTTSSPQALYSLAGVRLQQEGFPQIDLNQLLLVLLG